MNTSSKGFRVAANVILCLLTLACLLPLILLIMSSLTSEEGLLRDGYAFIPKSFGLESYAYLWTSRAQIGRAYSMTLLTTAAGTSLSLALTTLMAYPLSRKYLPGRNFFAFFVFFTMLFNGGLIPSYLMWTQTFHIKDTFFALVFPNLLLNGFAIIMMRTFFSTSIPETILEAARIDGATELGTLLRIVLPLSKPIMASIGLMTALAYWNDWLNGLYYLVKRTDLYTIQNLLNRLVTSADFLSNNAANSMLTQGIRIPSVGVRMAISVIAILPILVIYPFFQKGFVKGIVIGGVKG